MVTTPRPPCYPRGMLLLLLACADTADSATPAECVDEDGDGWCAGGTADDDCNDTDPRAYPGAAACECDCDRTASASECGNPPGPVECW